MIQEVQTLLEQNPNALPRKRLEQIRGYLVHIAQTYSMFSCYLIGLHMTIDIWRCPNRDEEGWRYTTSYVMGLKSNGDWLEDYDSLKAPSTVRAATRLSEDFRALHELLLGMSLLSTGGFEVGPLEECCTVSEMPQKPLLVPLSKLGITYTTIMGSGIRRFCFIQFI